MNYKTFAFLAILCFSFPIHPQAPSKELSLEDIYLRHAFRPASVFGINSMKDGLHYTTHEGTRTESFIVRFSYQTGKALDTLVRSSQLKLQGSNKPLDIESYSFSEDEKKILLATESEPIYRHSSKEEYYIYERVTKKLSRLSEKGKQMYATFSPAGDKIAFVRDNNIFIRNLDDDSEIQVTTDGKWNHIINGNCDWVYEEEFSFSRAFFWSPDGKRIAYYKFNESRVKEFTMQEYGSLYPKVYTYKYPKAGEENSIVKIYIYDLENNTSIKADIGGETNQYIPRIKWTKDPEQLCIFRMNRHQNKLELLLAEASSGKTRLLMKEENPYYIEITDDLTFLDDKKSFIRSSMKDGFNHLYQYDMNGKQIRQITSGNWDVTRFEGIDEKSGLLYYLSTEVSPTDRDLYSIKPDGSKKQKISTGKGTHNPSFSEGFKYFINAYSDANTPPFIALYSSNGRQIRVLEDNSGLKQKLKTYPLSTKEFFTFKTSEGLELNGWMIKPPDFDASQKYPVYMFVYGGPGSNKVNNNWEGEYMWYQLLAEKGYIVASVDNRGTGGKGQEFQKCTYKQLGKLETIDQTEAAKYLGALSYVDKNRIGIQGWSYGGYMAALCITKSASVFKMAISVAPVTNWRYYDTIYTERYLQTPQENPSGYDDNSPINFVKDMRGKFLLVHGTGDDNVHFQNSVEMVNALVKAGKHFDFYMYPDKNHHLSGGNAKFHLYSKMTDFILKNL